MTERSGIICAGNWIVDLVHGVESWPDESDLVRITAQTRGVGGGAANVIAALARLQTGLPLWPMGAVGDDEYAAFIRTECAGLGLPDTLAAKPGVPTAHTHVMSVAGRSRTFFYQGGANDVLGAADFPAGTFRDTPARMFYLGYLTLMAEMDRLTPDGTQAAKVLARARAAGLITAVDLVSGQTSDFAAIVAAAAPHIDYLILNEVEAARATGASDSADLGQMAADLLALGVTGAVVVHSAEQAVWCGADGTNAEAHVTPLRRDQIVSHLGAGDAFCAGLLYAIHEGWPPARALGLARAVARESLRGMTATEAIPKLGQLEGI
ncbi:MAG: carbohydrate kinase family protein [Pseudomonadota bacterium]